MPKRKRLSCCVPHCDTRESIFGEDDDPGTKLYKFPSDKSLMRKWVAQIGRGPNFIPTDRSRICSKHFQSGRKSYKPTHVDYIPSIFWYNTAKSSEFCSQCRRKVCKCGTEQMKLHNTTADIDFNEKEMLQLLRTIDEETEALENQADDVDAETPAGFDLAAVNLLDHTSADADVTTAIASFLDEADADYIDITEEVEHFSESTESFTSTPVERTLVDETIDRCVRGEDSVGEEILLRQFRPIRVRRDLPEPNQGMEDKEETTASVPTSTCEDKEPDLNAVATTETLEPIKPRPITAADLKLDSSKAFLQLGPDEAGEPDSELEREWKRRERKLVKQHKAEEKKMVLEIVRNNQVKNKVIDELKQELKELKKEKKSHLASLEALERNIKTEYEDRRKTDINNLLEEANTNLAQLQTVWAGEKQVLIQANSSLARLCKGEEVDPNQLHADFINSVLAASSIEPTLPQAEPQGVPHSTPRLLRYESCSESAEFMKYFTGFPTSGDFDQFYDLLEERAKSMRYWNGKSWVPNPPIGKRPKTFRIDIRNQLFLTLARYKRGFTTKELGYFFNVDPVYISCLFITFSKLIENELVELYRKEHNHVAEFDCLPEIVQTHYPKLHAALRLIEIRLESRPTFVALNNSKSGGKKALPTFKILFLCSPSGQIFFISPVYPGTKSDRDVILESMVLDLIPAGSEVFVDKEFDVANECILKQLQLHVFPQENSPHTLSDDDPWEIKLMIKCKSQMEKLVGLMRYFRIFDNELHLTGVNNHSPTVIRVVLLLQHYIDIKCLSSQAVNSTNTVVTKLN